MHSADGNLASNHDINIILSPFEANVVLYHFVSKPRFLNFRLMPHLVVRGHILPTPGSCQRYVFSQERHIFGPEVFFRIYLPLAFEVSSLID